jgi:hypothetical protein
MKKNLLQYRWARAFAPLSVVMVLTACGGGGSDNAPVQLTYPVNVSVTGAGKVSSVSGIDCGTTCCTNIPTNTSITLTAAPSAGHLLQTWGGACAGTVGNSCTVAVTQAANVTAAFSAQPFALSVSVSGNGRLSSQPTGIDCGSSCNADFAFSTAVVLTATPAQGQVLQSWGGACAAATGNTCSLTLSQATSVSATFAAAVNNFGLGVAVTGNGTVRSQPAGIDCGSICSGSFAESTTVVLTALPAQGQVFQAWGGACSGAGSTCNLTMSAARNVTATFAAATGSAPVWGAAVLLENSDDFNVTESGLVHQVNAVSPNGDAMVIWQQPDGLPNGGISKVYSRMYIAGQGWLPAVQVPGLSDFANRQLVGGRLFIDAQRVATWIRPGLDTRRFTPPGSWSMPINPPTAPSGAGQLSAAVMDEAGNIGIVTTGSDVYQITLAANDQWRDWIRLDASGALNTDVADIARSANGSAMAIWVERNPGESNDSMKAARFDPANGWQTPVTIDNSFDDVDQSSSPRVAMDGAGTAIAVWEQSNAIQVARYTPGTGWAAPVAYDAGALSTQDVKIRIAMAANGRAVVAWQSGLYAIKTMSFTPATGFSTPVIATPYALDRELGIDAQGNAQLVYVAVNQWPDPTSPEISVYARQMPWGQAWGPQALLETQPGGIKTGLAVSFNPAGGALASWAQNDTVSGVRNSLWANLLR